MRWKNQEAVRIANMFNCKLGKLPLTYLGIQIGLRKVTKGAEEKILSKLGHRLDNWKNNLLSSGTRLILVNCCFSNQPMYTIGFYRLSNQMHRRIDTIRSRFF